MPLLDVRSACPYMIRNPPAYDDDNDETSRGFDPAPRYALKTGRSIQKETKIRGVAVTSIQFLLLLLVLKSRTTVTIVGDTSPVAGMLRRLWDAVIFL